MRFCHLWPLVSSFAGREQTRLGQPQCLTHIRCAQHHRVAMRTGHGSQTPTPRSGTKGKRCDLETPEHPVVVHRPTALRHTQLNQKPLCTHPLHRSSGRQRHVPRQGLRPKPRVHPQQGELPHRALPAHDALPPERPDHPRGRAARHQLAGPGWVHLWSGRQAAPGPGEPSLGPGPETRIDDGYSVFEWSPPPDPDWPTNAYIQWLEHLVNKEGTWWSNHEIRSKNGKVALWGEYRPPALRNE